MSVDLNKRWQARRPGKCNVCNRPFAEGETIGFDPKKPTWLNPHSGKEAYNYAHAGCIGAGERMMNTAPQQQQSPPPYSFDPRSQQGSKGNLDVLLRAFRSAIDAYLGDENPDDVFDYLKTEIPF